MRRQAVDPVPVLPLPVVLLGVLDEEALEDHVDPQETAEGHDGRGPDEDLHGPSHSPAVCPDGADDEGVPDADQGGDQEVRRQTESQRGILRSVVSLASRA